MRIRLREVDILAILGAALCAALVYTARYTINADGVSYLDLADRINAGDWAHFVQGYWSPLYPAMLALVSAITGLAGARLVPTVHFVNGVCLLAAFVVIWAWGRRATSPFFAASALAALLLCSNGAPRVEAITPDVLLLALMAGVTYELIVNGGRRWLLLGTLLGLAFLAKTSVWPWIVVGTGIRLWTAFDQAARRLVVRSTAVCAAVTLVWIVPMSLKDGQFTLGSAGSLNVCWYLRGCDSRTPDTQSGTHANDQNVNLSNGETITVVAFDDAARWTYQPWSDPTAWARGVGPRLTHAPDAFDLGMYWINLAGRVFGQWLLPLILAVLVPMAWVGWRPGLWRNLTTAHRDAMVVIVLGLLGLGQFVAVHAEPRLIAPFALMFALGVVDWLSPEAPGPEQAPPHTKRGKSVSPPARWRPVARRLAAAAGYLLALGLLVDRVVQGAERERGAKGGRAELDQTVATFDQQGVDVKRVAVIGPAMPITATAYWIGAHIVAQIPPSAVAAFTALPPAQQQQTLTTLFGGLADLVWLTNANGDIQMIPIQGAGGR